MSSIREKFLNSQVIKSETLEFPEIDNDGKPLKVKVKGISYAERTQLLSDTFLEGGRFDMVKMMPRAIIATFHDPDNNKPIFQAADSDTIANLAPEIIERARVSIWRVIGLSTDELEKKSEGTAVSAPSSL